MTTITRFTKEQLRERAREKVKSLEFAVTQNAFADSRAELEEELELARIALASLTAEPVLYAAEETLAYANMGEIHLTCLSEPMGDAVIPLYTAPPVQETGVYNDVLNIIGLLEKNEWAEHCTSTVLVSLLESEITRLVGKEQPAPERNRIRREHAEWSDKTFGDIGPVGPLKHLSKEALEAAADPSDPLEWADMQFLLWDAQRRMGISDEFITRAMIEKLAVNKKREWPEPKDGEPRLHIKEQPVPVVPEEIEPDSNNTYDYVDGWNACRAAMLQGAEPVSQTYELPELIEGMEVSIDVSTCDADAGNRYFGTVTEVSELDTAKNGYILLVQDAEPNFKTAGNSPVIPDGYALVPVEPTDEMIVAAMDSDDVTYNESDDTVFYVHHREIYKAMLAVAPKPETGPCTK